MSFIECPNLPTGDVKAVLISSNAGKEVIQSLEKRGVEALIVQPCADISPQVSSHPDMLFHHLGGNRMVFYDKGNSAVCRRLEELGFELTQCNVILEQRYPHDIALNAARIGNYLFCNGSHTDKTILNDCMQNKVHIIPVRQGYAKCSVCIADRNSIITADKGIATAAKRCGMNVLLIRVGFVDLPGYGSGFIGGCCGKLGSDKIFFCGDITAHPDFIAIKNFLSMCGRCDESGITIETFSNISLCDIGSIIPLTQTADYRDRK